jgi:hypothetical protein
MRPCSGAVAAAETSCAPTTLPAKASEPVISRTCSRIDRPSVPSGIRMTSDSAMKRNAPRCANSAA